MRSPVALLTLSATLVVVLAGPRLAFAQGDDESAPPLTDVDPATDAPGREDEPPTPWGRLLLEPLDFGRVTALHQMLAMPELVGGHTLGPGYLRVRTATRITLGRTNVDDGTDALLLERGFYDTPMTLTYGVSDMLDLSVRWSWIGRLGPRRVRDNGRIVQDEGKNLFSFGHPTLAARWIVMSNEDSVLAALTVNGLLKLPLGSASAERTGGLDLALSVGAMFEPKGPRDSQKSWQWNVGFGFGFPSLSGGSDYLPGASGEPDPTFFIGTSFGFLAGDWGPTNFAWVIQVQGFTSAYGDVLASTNRMFVDILAGFRGEFERWQGGVLLGITPNAPGTVDFHVVFVVDYRFDL